MGTITIKEVSRQYGVTQDVLRYYERAGMIPPVTRTAGGIRDYQEEDLGWVELALCMRSAGLSVEAISEYVRLARLGEDTIKDRLALLQSQREGLLAQQSQIAQALERLNYKIARYEEALKTGVLDWSKKEDRHGQDPEEPRP